MRHPRVPCGCAAETEAINDAEAAHASPDGESEAETSRIEAAARASDESEAETSRIAVATGNDGGKSEAATSRASTVKRPGRESDVEVLRVATRSKVRTTTRGKLTELVGKRFAVVFTCDDYSSSPKEFQSLKATANDSNAYVDLLVNSLGFSRELVTRLRCRLNAVCTAQDFNT